MRGSSGKKVPIAVLASGRGSGFEAIQRAIEAGELDAEIRLVLSDRRNALVLEKARARGLHTACVELVSGPKETAEARRIAHEQKVLAELAAAEPRFLVLAGYMRILTPRLIEAYRSDAGYTRIVNVHPSLLPAFPGIAAYAQAFEYGARVTGITVHLVEAEVDAGPICSQEAFSIADCSSAEEVECRGLAIEHRLFPQTLKWVLPEEFCLERRPGSKGPKAGRYCVRAN